MPSSRVYAHVSDSWDPKQAAALAGNEVDLLVYRSNRLGADLRITNFGGGNTSAKVVEPDPFNPDAKIEVLYVKGSGGDLGSMNRDGLASLDLGRLHALRRRYRGHRFEDEMVPLFDQCVVHGNPRPPSIDTPLHAFLPWKHVDHLHPDAVIAVAAAADGERLTREIWGGRVGWLGWTRPGFELALRLADYVERHPGLEGVVLANHGLFSWAETSEACYRRSLDLIEAAAAFLEQAGGGHRKPSELAFGRVVVDALSAPARRARAVALGPVVRGLAGRAQRMVGHFRDDDAVLDLIDREKAGALARLGTSCPDHFLRTKIRPLFLDLPPQTPLGAYESRLQVLADEYRREYTAYYERCKHVGSPAMRGDAPVVVLLPGIGMWSFGPNAQEARIAGEFYVNAINVMRGAESVSKYVALPEQEAFDIEYWLLEEAKVKRRPPERPLSRQVAFITGGASGIGLACAERILAEGGHVVLADLNQEALAHQGQRLGERWGRDAVRATVMDLRDPSSVKRSLDEAVLAFGGVDIVVNNAGLSISKPLAETTLADYDLLNDVMPRGSFVVAQEAVRIMRAQKTGGSIVYIVSKNALATGPNNVAYGTAKAAQLHQMRLVASEAGADGIRVNAVNPDAVIKGSSIWAGGWAEGRAKAYGIAPEELGAYYASRTILRREVEPADVASAVFALASDLFAKTTGAVLPVDAGVPMAFVR